MFNKRVGECFITIIYYKTRRVAECFICDKTRSTSLLEGDNFVLAEKIKVKVYVNEGKSLSTYKDTTRL